MAFVPGYENDIFISYSHTDNEPTQADQRGWVDLFEDLLRKRILTRLAGKIEIFRDHELRTYGKFSDQLADHLSKSAIFICVLSPPYAGSKWCIRELSEFYERAGSDRIIKVVKTPMDAHRFEPEIKSLFAKIKDVLENRFYTKDENSDDYRIWEPLVDTEHFKLFFNQADRLGSHLAELLYNLRDPLTSSSTVAASPDAKKGVVANQVGDKDQITVYLAETTKDLVNERNDVSNELRQFNFRVLPDQPLPQEAADLANATRNYLREAKLSIHMLGSKYGIRPESEDRSIPRIQYDLAAEISRERPLRQLVWMPDGLVPVEDSQQKFVDDVKNSSPDFLRTRIEDLKTEIHKKLKPDSTDVAADDSEADPNVFLFFHPQDLDSIKPLYNHLIFKESFGVKVSRDYAQSIQSCKQHLQATDAVLLYYGTADEDWFANVWRQIQRQISTGRTRPVLAKAIYAGEPKTTLKDMLQVDDPMIIKNYGNFTPSSLAPFIAKIRAAKGGSQ